MSTRLLINATILNLPRQTGLGVYAANLLPPLLRHVLDAGTFAEVVVIGDPEALRRFLGTSLDDSRIRLRSIETIHPIRRLISLDRMAVEERRRSGTVVLYSPTHHGVVRGGLRQIITVHDLFARLFPENYRRQYYYFRWYLPRVLANTCRVVVDSESTGDDLRRFYRNSPASTVIHAAVRADLPGTQPKQVSSLSDRPFFLFVGPSYRYKNCIRLIDAFAQLRQPDSARLVFIGGRSAYVDELRHHVQGMPRGLIDNVVFLDYTSTPELVWLYRNAIALMITTRYEGFGLPALEAMACGCPVIASRAGSLPEVCEEAALYVDPEDVSQIRETMELVAADSRTRERLLAAGDQNVKRFCWETSARKVYHDIVDCLQ
jgi:glycosyltransferase involved in cell wall biosynthesis